MTDRYLLVDFMNMAFRAHYAYAAQRAFTSDDGTPTGMTYGLLSMTLGLIRDTGATHVAFAAESRSQTHNAKLVETVAEASPLVESAFPHGYKGSRKEREPEMLEQLALSELACEAMGWPVYRTPGYEADDTLASLAMQIGLDGNESRIVTGDQDLWQCASDSCSIWSPRSGGVYLEITPALLPEFMNGLRADQIVDYKALVGDASDGYPGCPGVGPVAARKLLTAFGSVEGVYAGIDGVHGALRVKLEANRELVFLCHALAALDASAPVRFDPMLGKVTRPALPSAFAFVRKYGMVSLEKRLS